MQEDPVKHMARTQLIEVADSLQNLSPIHDFNSFKHNDWWVEYLLRWGVWREFKGTAGVAVHLTN